MQAELRALRVLRDQVDDRIQRLRWSIEVEHAAMRERADAAVALAAVDEVRRRVRPHIHACRHALCMPRVFWSAQFVTFKHTAFCTG